MPYGSWINDLPTAFFMVVHIANGVPIDVLAERLGTTRGALYKTLHDARRKLRGHLDDCGLALESIAKEEH